MKTSLIFIQFILAVTVNAQYVKRDFKLQPILSGPQFVQPAFSAGYNALQAQLHKIKNDTLNQSAETFACVFKPVQFHPIASSKSISSASKTSSWYRNTTSTENIEAIDCSDPSSCTVLPSQLLELEGNRISEDLVELNWKTIYESEIQEFEIERSLSTTAGFVKVGSRAPLPGLAYQKNYRSTDNNNLNAVSYYRIKQKDLSGDISYSNIIQVKAVPGQNGLIIFPNPTADKLQVRLSTALSGPAVFKITDVAGRVLITLSKQLATGENFFSQDVNTFASGTYFISVYRDDLPILNAQFFKN